MPSTRISFAAARDGDVSFRKPSPVFETVLNRRNFSAEI